jgi:PKHD-type hydroxylase
MFLQIPDLLSPTEVHAIGQIAAQVKYIDGKRSNPHNIAKQNVIADVADPWSQKASQIALGALQRSEQARNFVFPRRVPAPTLSRYAAGMKYGAHTDAAFLPVAPEPLRSDVSCTIFISKPEEYQGGELLIHLGTEAVAIKAAAGAAVFYPSTTLHEVIPVSAGERIVMITFIESQIPDQLQRELLYTLGEVRALEGLKMDWRNRTQMEFVIANLHRMWSAGG